ncbi:chaperone modulator CbpM [Roseateles asaccharophilus]|uniref:Chaperone modulatory protein CbpM n=1 Tax=Roseateles asaccharophilus TaxID=582607 RepID=A0ABU2AFJ4_9BURK|nr:chaperone modulator CbpM [Roseateles asaccharophilus]MDR7335383.1 chaperone modulatory protein CbpM [Roseateles asaccharophilus]
MNDSTVLVGVLVDDQTLTLDELACACGVSADWLSQRLDAGLLVCCSGEGAARRFASAQLDRALRLQAIERDFDANQELAALVVDLIDEIHRLRSRST